MTKREEKFRELIQAAWRDGWSSYHECKTRFDETRDFDSFMYNAESEIAKLEKSEQKPVTAEEILERIVPRIKNHPNFEFILKAMEEYARQFQKEQVTDEEIKKQKLENHFYEEDNLLEHWLTQISLTGEIGIRLKMSKRLEWVRGQIDKLNNK
jgi:hypothetical protein